MMPNLAKRLVLLDRDGVLNIDRPDYVSSPEELELIPEALRACARLTQAGIRIGICTNQAGIARGRYTHAALEAIHAKLSAAIHAQGGKIDRILYCESCDDAHPMRKPNPGMLLDQAAHFGLDLAGVPFVGDSIGDIRAAIAAGALPVLVKTGKGAQTLINHPEETTAAAVYNNLEQAVNQWLG